MGETHRLTHMISLVALCAKPIDEIHQRSVIKDDIKTLTSGSNRSPPVRF